MSRSVAGSPLCRGGQSVARKPMCWCMLRRSAESMIQEGRLWQCKPWLRILKSRTNLEGHQLLQWTLGNGD